MTQRPTWVYVVVGLFVLGSLALPVAALTFDVKTSAGARFQASPSGPTVHFNEDRDIPSGNPFPNGSAVHIQTSSGSAFYKSSVDTSAQIDDINGTWSNVSELDVTNGNLTIDPKNMEKARISGDADTFAFKGLATNEDGTIDAVISATSGSADVTLKTDVTNPDKQVGLVDADTGNGLSVDVVNAQGVAHFEDVDLSTREVKVQDAGTLVLRDETDPHDKITKASTEVTFFGEDGETIQTFTTDAQDGEVELAGFPTDKQFIAQIDADDYAQCQVLLPDINQQNRAFCLNTTEHTNNVEKELVVEDETGRFDEPTTEIVIQRPINTSRYTGAGVQNRTYKNVRGDQLGADRAYITRLQEDVRYRILVQNVEGDVRRLGSFTPKVAGTTTLEVSSVSVNQTQVNDVLYNATFVETNSGKKVVVSYNDTQDLTQTLYIEVYERNNRGNKLVSNTTFTGPLGEAVLSEPVPQAENETEWIVRVTANRDGAEDFNLARPLSPRQTILPGLPIWFKAITSIGLIWVTAGLFSQINGGLGAIVVASEGAVLWFVDYVPPDLGVGVIILSLVTAGLIFINDRRDGGL